ncbi:hypothetical protein ACTI_67890 [Actinoplanes sp. OR16]|uniref:hypothetical protein n=1 Tax=Actinoplanes sp. OR16 TaxID=946334 RepID=UPI000F6C4B45|nr:hypothetical protein [Actinoplanes sp. OR16]BBH70104.1 hypothetical protein ACTI_67890 [Actinoplanes sp. OR16]
MRGVLDRQGRLPMSLAVTEQADRFTLTTGRDGRVLLSLALRRHPWAIAGDYVRAQRYWACAPGGAQPRWLTLATAANGRQPLDDPGEADLAADAHAIAVAYVPGVFCSGCGDRRWRPVSRGAVSRYVLSGVTGACLTCREVAAPAPAAKPAYTPAPPPPPADFGAPVVVDARILSPDEARWGEAAADRRQPSPAAALISRNYGLGPASDRLPVVRGYLGDL